MAFHQPESASQSYLDCRKKAVRKVGHKEACKKDVVCCVSYLLPTSALPSFEQVSHQHAVVTSISQGNKAEEFVENTVEDGKPKRSLAQKSRRMVD
jgi:hypothetical protein